MTQATPRGHCWTKVVVSWMDLFWSYWNLGGLSCSDRCKPSGGEKRNCPRFLFVFCSLFMFMKSWRVFSSTASILLQQFSFLLRVDPWPLFLIIFLTSASSLAVEQLWQGMPYWSLSPICLVLQILLTCFETSTSKKFASKGKKWMIECFWWNLKFKNSWKCSHIRPRTGKPNSFCGCLFTHPKLVSVVIDPDWSSSQLRL